MANRFVRTALRSLFLFLLSILLVAGFYFHSGFYSIGLYPLLLVGGFVTFLVIMAARLILAGDLPRGRPSGELVFRLDEGDRIVRNVVTVVVVPLEAGPDAGVGQVLRARYETGQEFGRLLVTDSARKFLADVTDDESREAGHRDAARLREAGLERWQWAPGDVVSLLHVQSLGARR